MKCYGVKRSIPPLPVSGLYGHRVQERATRLCGIFQAGTSEPFANMIQHLEVRSSGMFGFSRFCHSVQRGHPQVSSVPLRVSRVPHSRCSFSVQWETPVSVCPRCVVRLRAWKSGLAAKNAGKYPLSNPKGKEELCPQKTFGCEENSSAASPCQGGAGELWRAKSGAPLGKDFFCNFHPIHVFLSASIHC